MAATKQKPRKMRSAGKRQPKNLKAPKTKPVKMPPPIDAPEESPKLPADGRAATGDLLATCGEYIAAYNALKELENQMKPFKAIIDRLEPTIIEDMGAGGCTKVSVAGRTLYRKEVVSVSVITELKAAAIEAARESGFGDLLTFNAQTLTARMKQYVAVSGISEDESDDAKSEEAFDESKLPEALKPYLKVFKQNKLGNTKA